MIQISGLYQSATSSRVDEVVLSLEEGVILIRSGNAISEQFNYSSCKINSTLPGVPASIALPNGAVFTPHATGFKWPAKKQRWSELLNQLESKWHLVLASVAALILCVFLFIQSGVPLLSKYIALWLPSSVSEVMGKQTLLALDKLHVFEVSSLEQRKQEEVRARWDRLLAQSDLSITGYSLRFRSWSNGPNALALADGTVIVTDSLVKLMAEDLRQLDAILLHEIGHIENRHVLQAAIRSTIITTLYTLILGDLDGIAESILGSGVSLIDLAFSRDMEREADEYAYQSLKNLGRPMHDFSDALKTLKEVYEVDGESDHWQYLSSHPDIDQRIQAQSED